MTGRSHRWDELSANQRRLVVALGVIEVVLAVAAWTDLARRPAGEVNGSKRVWAVAIFVNILGPLAYFRWGRRPPADAAAD